MTRVDAERAPPPPAVAPAAVCAGLLHESGGGRIEVPLDGHVVLATGVVCGVVPGPGGRRDLLMLLPPGWTVAEEAAEPRAGAARVTAETPFALRGPSGSGRWTWAPCALRVRADRAGAVRCDLCHRALRPDDLVVVCPGCGARFCVGLCADLPTCVRCHAPLA
ncbi:MAG: hypothetical protein ABIO70_10635 [Pseudomonadota bacterium]